MIAKEIHLLDQIDNAEVEHVLVMNVDRALNNYIKDQISVESSKIQAVIWNKLPSDEMLARYFNANFKEIKYDKAYGDLIMKRLDYSRQDTLSKGRTWEKFLFIPTQNGEFITLFFSYTMKWSIFDYLPFMNTATKSALKIENFFTEASIRMFNKLLNPTKRIYSHRQSLDNNKSTIQYFLVYHNNREGYLEKMITSFEDALIQQEELDKRKLSSCILMIKDGQRRLYSIRHPIIQGDTVPDFHAYYGLQIKKGQSSIHDDL